MPALKCSRCDKPSVFDICVKCVIELNREEPNPYDFDDEE